MKLWIDNTGLHSAGCALLRGAREEVDVRGLLQMATLIVFGDEIRISGFEADSIAGRSREFIDHFYRLGVDPDALIVSPESEESYRLACEDAANSLAKRLVATFQPSHASIIGLEPSDLPARLSAAQTAFVELAAGGVSNSQLQEVRESALSQRASGAVAYMIATSEDLRKAVRQLVMKPGWTEMDAYQLNAYIRYYLNTSLAAIRGSAYTPAIARAQLQRRRSRAIVSQLLHRVDNVVAERLDETPLTAPSVALALVNRAGGKPEAVVEEALIFREKASSLRKHLTKKLAGVDESTGEGQYTIDEELVSLADDLRRELGLVKATNLGEALEVSIVLGVPVPRVSGKTVIRWANEQRRARRVSVLTELSREYIGSLGAEDNYHILKHQCRS